MSKTNEPTIATGIHAVAAATINSKGASRAELDLAAEILKRNPPRPLPRELAGAIETFNRHMDAAIESCNESAGEATRAMRRARLASDLECSGLVLIEAHTLAELLSRKLAGDVDPLADEDEHEEDLGAELLEPCPNPHCEQLTACLVCGKRDYQPSATLSAEAPIGANA